jgi:hypothetical protein
MIGFFEIDIREKKFPKEDKSKSLSEINLKGFLNLN